MTTDELDKRLNEVVLETCSLVKLDGEPTNMNWVRCCSAHGDLYEIKVNPEAFKKLLVELLDDLTNIGETNCGVDYVGQSIGCTPENHNYRSGRFDAVHEIRERAEELGL
jgi:hypothetical protein